MSGFGNTSSTKNTPKWPKTRQTRATVFLPVTAQSLSGSNILTVADTTLVANGMYVSGNNINVSSDVPGFFKGTVTVTNKTPTTITLSTVLSNTVQVGDLFEFDTVINYKANTSSNSYFTNTSLIDANTITTTANVPSTAISHTGWNVIVFGTGGRAGRVQVETLVALSNPTALGIVIPAGYIILYISDLSAYITDQSGNILIFPH